MIIGSNFKEYCKFIKTLNNVNEAECVKCGKIIWYPHTKVNLKKNGDIAYINANHNTCKSIGESTYTLKVCYSCLSKKYPEICNKKSSKLFNTINKYVKYAFYVSDIDYENQRKSHGITLNKLIELYGKNEGTIKWNKYVEKQRISNTFEYKSAKFGMTESDFNKFNKNRACTLTNFKKRYGDKIGLEKWNNYCDRQAYTNTEEYYIEKLGKEEGIKKFKEINKRKALTLDNYIKRLGIELGTSEFKKYINRTKPCFSKVSQEFFNNLESKLRHLNLTTYYETKSSEFGKILKGLNSYCKIDYYIKELNLGIEYIGDYWHANPSIYESNQIVHSGLTALEIWERDASRINYLNIEHNISIINIWQSDDNIDRDSLIKKIVYEIESRI